MLMGGMAEGAAIVPCDARNWEDTAAPWETWAAPNVNLYETGLFTGTGQAFGGEKWDSWSFAAINPRVGHHVFSL